MLLAISLLLLLLPRLLVLARGFGFCTSGVSSHIYVARAVEGSVSRRLSSPHFVLFCLRDVLLRSRAG